MTPPVLFVFIRRQCADVILEARAPASIDGIEAEMNLLKLNAAAAAKQRCR